MVDDHGLKLLQGLRRLAQLPLLSEHSRRQPVGHKLTHKLLDVLCAYLENGSVVSSQEKQQTDSNPHVAARRV